jgi:response regulator RpfG family c-di-GMP phosphodiesterase
LTSHKSFRNAFPLSNALDEIKRCRESQYDPNVVDICIRLFRDLKI